MKYQGKILSVEEFSKALKSHNLKITEQRLAVHEAMMELGHACADMVANKIRGKEQVKITVASVYNILSQMAYYGIYHYCFSASNKMFFDVNPSKHVHLYDINSDEFKDISDDDLIKYVEDKVKSRRFKGYKIDNVSIQVVCHPSRKKNAITY